MKSNLICCYCSDLVYFIVYNSLVSLYAVLNDKNGLIILLASYVFYSSSESAHHILSLILLFSLFGILFQINCMHFVFFLNGFITISFLSLLLHSIHFIRSGYHCFFANISWHTVNPFPSWIFPISKTLSIQFLLIFSIIRWYYSVLDLIRWLLCFQKQISRTNIIYPANIVNKSM